MPFDPRVLITAVHLSNLRGTYPDLDGWTARSNQLEEPQLGSELDIDTAATHGMGVPLHTLAKHNLVSATQHLNLARTSVEAKEVFPLAHPTAIRGALLAACRGVWMLHPPEPAVRQLRAARVAMEMHQRLLEWIREPESGVDRTTREEAEQLFEAQYQQLRSRDDVRALRYTDTAVVRDAGEVVFSEATQQGAMVALWRQLSGDAHGLLWTTMTRASTARTPVGRNARYPAPMTQMTAGGDLGELVDAFSAAYRVLRVGWSLFDQRCTSP
jgi:hypothetical protein